MNGDLRLERENENDGVLDVAALGDVVGAVGSSECTDGGGHASRSGDGEWTSTFLAAETELHSVPGHATTERLAAIDAGRVVVYGAFGPPPHVDRPGVARIEVRNDYDGVTPLGTIDDAELVGRLVDDYNRAAPDESAGQDSEGTRYFVAFVEPNGLATTAVFDTAIQTFADGRHPGELWTTSMEAARISTPTPVIAGITIDSGGGGEAVLHPMGTCQRDRPDLMTGAGEALHIRNSTGAEIFGITVTPEHGDISYLEATETLTLEPFTGTVSVEVLLQRADGRDLDVCTVVAT